MGAASVSFNGGKKMEVALKDLAKRITKGGFVDVGFLADAQYPSVNEKRGTKNSISSVATVAFLDEFGTSRAPARPFMRTTLAEATPMLGDKIAHTLKATGYDVVRTLSVIGLDLKEKIQETIYNWPADNAPRTVAVKKFNKGLVDSSLMHDKVDYVVRT